MVCSMKFEKWEKLKTKTFYASLTFFFFLIIIIIIALAGTKFPRSSYTVYNDCIIYNIYYTMTGAEWQLDKSQRKDSKS